MRNSNFPNIGMRLPKEYFVLWYDEKQKAKFFFTNNPDLAFKKEVLNDGVTYIDNRYKAKLRLYWHLVRKQLSPNNY
jgi:hypothetical protein